MKCNQCGTENMGTAEFCIACGGKLTKEAIDGAVTGVMRILFCLLLGAYGLLEVFFPSHYWSRVVFLIPVVLCILLCGRFVLCKPGTKYKAWDYIPVLVMMFLYTPITNLQGVLVGIFLILGMSGKVFIPYTTIVYAGLSVAELWFVIDTFWACNPDWGQTALFAVGAIGLFVTARMEREWRQSRVAKAGKKSMAASVVPLAAELLRPKPMQVAAVPEEIKKYGDLLGAGLLTQEEFEKKKQELLQGK